ncbi:MAG: AMP-binding protein, partial [Pseudomonadota bacterium]
MSENSLEEAIQSGMLVAYHAERTPQHSAVVTEYGDRTFAELNANANRLVRLLQQHGIGAGDSVAIVSKNRPEFIDVLAATTRAGIRFTPINFHLKGEEIGYIVDNCEAKAFFADAALGPPVVEATEHAPNASLKVAIGGEVSGFVGYNESIDDLDGSNIADPQLGSRMLYTSGTTGRPKGVYRKDRLPEAPIWDAAPNMYTPGVSRGLVTGPAYHAAPLLIDIVQPLWSGVGIVMMDRWDAERTLQLISDHKITHTHMVATMFHRLLQLPEATRAQYDISSMQFLIHGAAPCPVHVKQAIIEWFGPIVWEYYAATEGGGGFLVGAEEWLTKPGTVGRPG